MPSEPVTASTSRSTEALAMRRVLATLLLIGICPALFAGIPRFVADGPAGDDTAGFEDTVPTSLVAVVVLPSPAAGIVRTFRSARPASLRLDPPSPLSLRAPPGD